MAGAGLHHCSECPATFSTARAKASHAKVHNNGVRCPVCDQEVRYLAAHVKREHGEDPLVRLEVGLAEAVAEIRTLRRENAELKTMITRED